MEERDVPVGVFHFDCFWMKGFQWCDFEFDEEFFPDAGMQLKRMRDKGYKVCYELVFSEVRCNVDHEI